MSQALETYQYNTKDYVLYAKVTPKVSAQIPYYCNNFAAYNNGKPAGTIDISQLANNLLPVAAAAYGGNVLADQQQGILKPLQDYGTVFNLNGKVIKYDPATMQAQVGSSTLDEFNALKDKLSAALNAAENKAGDVAQAAAAHPKLSIGLLIAIAGAGYLFKKGGL